jgi:ribonuclease J
LNASEMSFNVVALGGLGEIGMNCLALECQGRILLIDCGAMFSSEGIGIDLIHPGFEYLNERREDLEGVIITHAHEDHIAGVPFLLREVDIPVFGTPYALGLLKGKMEEFPTAPKLAAHEVVPGAEVEIGPFTVKSFPMPHSIIENMGLRVSTPAGRLLHTGDFKLGLESPDQGEATLRTLRENAEGGIDLMLADSTGGEEDNTAGEERAVAEALDRLIRNADGRVFVAIFSSNIRRLGALFDIAASCGRQVTLCGRSVLNHFGIASGVGGIAAAPGLLVPLDKAADLPGNRSLVVVSGTQGEMRSALGRLAHNNHHALAVEKKDLIVLSSRFIPGNELAIGRIIDQLHRLGARVVHRGIQHDVHVSGHGSRAEIRKAIAAVNPRCFLPVHGTYRHLVACAGLAREANVEHVEVVSDGDLVRCGAAGLDVVRDHAPVRRVFIDGKSGLNESIIKDRRLLGSHGVLVVTYNADDQGFISGGIELNARGVTQDEALPWLTEQIRIKVEKTVREMDEADRLNTSRAAELVRGALRRKVRKLISREPYVLVSILARPTE